MNKAKEKNAVTGYAWVILIPVYLGTVAAALMVFKVGPLTPVLMETFTITLEQAGMLTGVMGFTALLLVLPISMLIRRIGLKITGLIGLATIILDLHVLYFAHF